MRIIPKEPGASGAYPPIQEWAGVNAPEGFAAWPDAVDTADFYAHNGFVVLDILRDTVKGYSVNTEAWEAWKEAQPEPEPEPEPGPEPAPAADAATWSELAQAIKGGVDNAE